jgi:hypothetical protein
MGIPVSYSSAIVITRIWLSRYCSAKQQKLVTQAQGR